MSSVVIGPPRRKPLCKIMSGIVRNVSQMWARNHRCTVPTLQSGIFFRRLRSAAKTKIPSEIAPNANPSGVPPTV